MIPCAGNSAPDSFGQTDFLYGGAGNDIYVLLGDAALVKNLNEETDTVQIGYITNHALLNNLEKLAPASGVGASNGSGNALANTMLRNGFDNRLVGISGDDTLSGGAG